MASGNARNSYYVGVISDRV